MVLITSDKKEEEEFNSEIRRDFGFHNYVRFFAQLVGVSGGVLHYYYILFMVDLYYFQDIGKGESIK